MRVGGTVGESWWNSEWELVEQWVRVGRTVSGSW